MKKILLILIATVLLGSINLFAADVNATCQGKDLKVSLQYTLGTTTFMTELLLRCSTWSESYIHRVVGTNLDVSEVSKLMINQIYSGALHAKATNSIFKIIYRPDSSKIVWFAVE